MELLTITLFSIIGSTILLLSSKKFLLYLAIFCLVSAQTIASIVYWHGYTTLVGVVTISLLSIYSVFTIAKHYHHIEKQIIYAIMSLALAFCLTLEYSTSGEKLILGSAMVMFFSGLFSFSKSIENGSIIGIVLITNGLHLISTFSIWTADLAGSWYLNIIPPLILGTFIPSHKLIIKLDTENPGSLKDPILKG